MSVPYIYGAGDFSPQTQYIGVDQQCVALVRKLTGAPKHDLWQEGAKVTDAIKIPGGIASGTAIATFVNGHYVSKHGSHAAIFVRAVPDGSGFVVYEQWEGHLPNQRTLYFNRKGYHAAEDKGESYSVIN